MTDYNLFDYTLSGFASDYSDHFDNLTTENYEDSDDYELNITRAFSTNANPDKEEFCVNEYGYISNIETDEAVIPFYNKGGYITSDLHYADGTTELVNNHRVCAEAFVNNPFLLNSVDHTYPDKSNMHISNLTWMLLEDNISKGNKVIL